MAEFLASRYFNRAVFFLTTSVDNEKRKEAESLGFRDLQIAGDMDVEIVDQCLEMGFKINRGGRYELMMSRIRGLVLLAEFGYSPEELFLEDLINDIYQDLQIAVKNPSHELFRGTTVAERLQKFDFELMKYFSQTKDDKVNAARVAIRLLVEDEYVFDDIEQEATKMLLAYLESADDDNCPQDEDGQIASELKFLIDTMEQDQETRCRSYLKGSNASERHMKSLTGSVSTRNGLTEDEVSAVVRRRSRARRESLKGDLTMEIF